MGDCEEDFVYVYLEFNENLTTSIFSESLFLRVANLHKPNPLVQINNLVFKGVFDECVGTNLFFKEIENPSLRTNIYEKETAIRLKPTTRQTKIIRLKQIILPRKMLCSKQPTEPVTLNLNQDYQVILDKLEQGVLNITDIECKENDPDEEAFNALYFESKEEIQTETDKGIENYGTLLDDESPRSRLEAKYERLKRLARRPVKRIPSPQRIAECSPQYKNSYEYHNLEKQILQSSDAFRSNSIPIMEKSFIGGVDIDRCTLKGMLSYSDDRNKNLTLEEQSKVFSIDNLENLSIPARYIVVKKCLSEIETLIANSTAEELSETDENSRTVQDFYDIFKKLAVALEHHMGQISDGSLHFTRKTTPEVDNAEFITYKYNRRNDLVDNINIFDENEWTDCEDNFPKCKVESDSEKHVDSDMSVDDQYENFEVEDMD